MRLQSFHSDSLEKENTRNRLGGSFKQERKWKKPELLVGLESPSGPEKERFGLNSWKIYNSHNVSTCVHIPEFLLYIAY